MFRHSKLRRIEHFLSLQFIIQISKALPYLMALISTSAAVNIIISMWNKMTLLYESLHNKSINQHLERNSF